MRSLFERLVDCGYPSHVLSLQYRMHPMISEFPSMMFYEGKVHDGENVLKRKLIKDIAMLENFSQKSVFINLSST